jgi:predicted DNA-binding protein (MmcQ/YjbR family)
VATRTHGGPTRAGAGVRKAARRATSPLAAAEDRLRRLCLSLPETREDHPWGHSAFKVRGKAFLFMATEEGGLSLSVKLGESGLLALSLPFAAPTGYGLGKSGWVTARFPRGGRPPVPVLAEWVLESYRAIAPKKLVAALDNQASPVGWRRPTKKS